MFVWGSRIGIFLGAMSGGYWLGGWLSERWSHQALLNALPCLLVRVAQPAKSRFEIVETRDSAYSAMTVVDHLMAVSGRG